MTEPFIHASDRKDLQDLRNLSRAPILSYLQKQAEPSAPRAKTAALAPARYPILAAFAPNRLFKWIWEYLSHRIGPRHPFLTYAKSGADQGIYKLEGDGEVRIALAGDWATGTDEAECVAELISAFKPHYSIHLGDVYYVGGPDEVDVNFLGIRNPAKDYAPCLWPNGSRGSFALNGNHEMYARGYAYFDRMLPTLGLITDEKPLGQKASFFCLENSYWRIIALDTGYDSIGWPIIEYVVQPDCALRPEQIEWLRTKVQPRNDDPRGIIVLTHHQYYSRYDFWYPKQAKQLAEFFSRPVLWFWGHEHRLAVYNEFRVQGGIPAFGRCIGHGGMPVDLPPATPKHSECAVEYVDERHYPNDENLTIGFNGHAQLTLRDDRLSVQYVDVHGAVIFSEAWMTKAGGLERIPDPPLSRT
ncbi:MAG: metallophosphoesterase [Xanthobacteraceae bacterium]